MGLLQLGEFELAGGQTSNYIIDCSALTPTDWEAAATMAVEFLPPFGVCVGVPRGGLPFADALRKHSRACSVSFEHPPHHWCEGKPLPMLLAEDVCTTGGSLERFRKIIAYPEQDVIGVCLFARGPCPDWVTPVFSKTQRKD